MIVDEKTIKERSFVAKDQIIGNRIILDGKGQFPKDLIIILESGRKRIYRILKTKNGGFILNA